MNCKIISLKERTVLYRRNQQETLPIGLIPCQSKFWANSIYFSDNINVFDLWGDEGHPYPIQVIAKHDMKCIACDQYDFVGLEREAELINQVERLIGKTKPINDPFMKWLGDEGYIFKCFADEDMNTEYAVPFVLLNHENWEESRYLG